MNAWLKDFRQDLKSVNCPLLVIQGEKDNILPVESTKAAERQDERGDDVAWVH